MAISYTIDMPHVNSDGTIDVIDLQSCFCDYPFTWQYKIYDSFQSNQKRLLNMLFGRDTVEVAFTERFSHYLENRKLLYEEASQKYFNIVQSILNADFSSYSKKKLIQEIDLALNMLYPYTN